MLKVLITGAKGMLGRTLCQNLNDVEIIATDRAELNIANAKETDEVIGVVAPDVVIHCAAMTAVDLCETEKDRAFQINAAGTANVAGACNRHQAKLIAISTDYVFDGTGSSPYTEYDIPTGGRSVYGQSKWAGEQAVRILCPNHIIGRVAWLYGPGGPSFVHTMLKFADGSRPVLKVVDDQRGNPTSTFAVCRALQGLLRQPEIVGTFHLTCEGETTWYGFAKHIFECMNIDQRIEPCTTEEFSRPAPRPKNSCLEKMNLRLYGLEPMSHWADECRSFLTLKSL